MSGTFVNSIIILIRKSSVTGVHKLLKTLESELKNMDKYFNYRAKQNFQAPIDKDKNIFIDYRYNAQYMGYQARFIQTLFQMVY